MARTIPPFATCAAHRGHAPRIFKAEVLYRRGPWRGFEAVAFATLEWLDGFNNRRLLKPTGNIPPAEAEPNVDAAPDPAAMAASR